MQTPRGEAISGATLCWHERGTDLERFTESSCTSSDRDGQFRLPARARGVLAAGASGFRTELQSLVAGAREPLLIVLEPAAHEAVSGSLVDATGGSIAGALVVARAIDGDAPTFALSDGEGYFSLTAHGVALLSARASGYSEAVRRVQAPASGLRITLLPASSLTGVVVASGTQSPLADVEVRASNVDGLVVPTRLTVTAQDGSFVFDELAAGSYRVSAGGKRWQVQHTWVQLGVGEADDGARLELPSAAGLRGSVHVDGDPCADGHVWLRQGDVLFAATTTADGAVELGGFAPGDYEVEVRCGDAIPEHGSMRLSSDDSVVRHWNLRSGGVVLGRVERDGGAPYADALVELRSASDGAAPSVSSPADVVRICPADRLGSFRCTGLPPGRYELTLTSRYSEPVQPPTAVELIADARPFVVLVAPPRASVQLIPPQSAGSTLGFVAPRLAPAGGGDPIATEREGARFVARGLPLGRYRVQWGSIAREVTLERDGQVVEVGLEEPALHSLVGTVSDALGNPVVDAWVRAQDESARTQRLANDAVLTDDRGAFLIEGLPEGQYTVLATLGAAHAAGVAEVPVEMDLRLTLDP